MLEITGVKDVRLEKHLNKHTTYNIRLNANWKKWKSMLCFLQYFTTQNSLLRAGTLREA